MKADDKVKDLQTWLRNLSMNVGPIDGIFGLRTARAYANLLEIRPEAMREPVVAVARAAIAAQVPRDSETFYGPPRSAWEHDPTETNKEHCKLLDVDWYRQNMVAIGLPIVGVKRIHRRAAPLFLVLMAEAAAAIVLNNYIWEIKHFGTWAFRLIRGSSETLSEHAHGAAVDINAPSNPRGKVGCQPEWFVAIAESWGWTWGGRWKGEVRDDMHFQWSR